MVPVIIELTSSLRFITKCNAYLMLGASLYLIVTGEVRLALEMYLFLAAFIYFIWLMLDGHNSLIFRHFSSLFHWLSFDRKKRLNHLVLTEAETGKCFGVHFCEQHFNSSSSNECNNDQMLMHNSSAHNWQLCEQNSKVTPFGCWLAFKNISPYQHILPSWGDRLHWVFVLKALVPIAQYKSLCRHLIWHSISTK